MGSPPAEVDYDLEIPVEGEPKPASFFKLADDYACLFELAREQRLSLVKRYACGKLIINCLLRQRRRNRPALAVFGVAVPLGFRSRLPCRLATRLVGRRFAFASVRFAF